jgi:hypothetical protein
MATNYRKYFIWLLVSFTFLFIIFNMNSLFINFHKLTPEGKVISSKKQIKKDVAYILKDNYKVTKVDNPDLMPSISIYLGKHKQTLERAFEYTGDKHILIITEDRKIRKNDIDLHNEGKVLATKQAVSFLIYFINREFDPKIKAVSLFYSPRMFDWDSTETSIVIVIDEFINEYERLKSKGFKGDELERKLQEKFIY